MKIQNARAFWRITAAISVASVMILSFQNCGNTTYQDDGGIARLTAKDAANAAQPAPAPASGTSGGGTTIVNPSLVSACTAGSVSACSVTNGTGTQTCNSTGSAYGACVTAGCNKGFMMQNGSCVQDTTCAGRYRIYWNGRTDLVDYFTMTCNGDQCTAHIPAPPTFFGNAPFPAQTVTGSCDRNSLRLIGTHFGGLAAYNQYHGRFGSVYGYSNINLTADWIGY